MAIILDGPVTPDDGTIFVRNIPAQTDAAALDEIMPDVYDNALEVDFTVVSRRGNTARFRAHDAPAHINPRDNLVMNRAPLVPLTDSKPVLGENELARLYGLHYANDPKAALADAIYNDLESGAADVKRRAQQAKGQVLSTGTFVINEGGVNGTIDYGVPSGNKISASGGQLWSATTTADIVTFLNTARQTYVALNGYAPGRALTTTPVVNYMQQNTKLQSMAVQQFGPNLGGYAGLLPQNALNAIFGAYNLPPLSYICDAQVSVDGTNTPLLPTNVFILLPPEGIEIGRMQWGPTVTAQKLAASGNLTAAGVPGIVGFVDENDEFPYKQRTIVDSLALPAITNAYGVMILTVA